ncbi:hypothetical protein GCM10010320_39850 [Streptomyces caelestis]|nr:hypothetical protein GCM10010320_39850 [Streptomyces caelestis]
MCRPGRCAVLAAEGQRDAGDGDPQVRGRQGEVADPGNEDQDAEHDGGPGRPAGQRADGGADGGQAQPAAARRDVPYGTGQVGGEEDEEHRRELQQVQARPGPGLVVLEEGSDRGADGVVAGCVAEQQEADERQDDGHQSGQGCDAHEVSRPEGGSMRRAAALARRGYPTTRPFSTTRRGAASTPTSFRGSSS